MKIKTSAVAVIIFASIFGTIAITSAFGLWNTVNTKEPALYTTGEFAGEYNPADIRGSYNFGEISDLFEVSLEDLGIAFALKDEKTFATFQCKELEAIYTSAASEGKEVGTDSVKTFVALYKSLPITLNDTTYLPEPAVNILRSKVKLTEEQSKYLDTHTIAPLDAAISSDTKSQAQEESTAKVKETSTTEKIIKGSTTFKDLIDWGVKTEEIEKVINDKIPSTGKLVKDYATEKGVEFSTLKESLQSLVDAQNK
ncbi:hypothetical protein CLHOM_11680 [Clostridium homopropionicum DSM 5847]|uniref:Uncharacterized protein n=1 Tax=Clostridium homopropionicum DSM 5847 TaxID=1121318 RepID=A0A0L6ZBJ2_9CLOT|nr:hypothetical protein [Clostridium homopropionicum]KOA20349.1 hypothetical protein CLHOM_11680 [Clostridium homopropionicum DSM 5847]SFG73775.1 hypothetical protein SAMN04488501_1153 [Clostridium homopropionicum]